MSESSVREEEYAQLRRAIRVDLTDELSGWVRRRFWWMAGLCAFAGVVGISSLFVLATQNWLEKTLTEQVSALEENMFAVQQKTIDTLVENLIEARLLTSELEGRIELIMARIDEADENLDSLQTATASTRLLARKLAQVTSAATNLAETNSAEESVNLLKEANNPDEEQP